MAWWVGRSVVRMLKGPEGREAEATGEQSLGQVPEKRKKSGLMCLSTWSVCPPGVRPCWASQAVSTDWSCSSPAPSALSFT